MIVYSTIAQLKMFGKVLSVLCLGVLFAPKYLPAVHGDEVRTQVMPTVMVKSSGSGSGQGDKNGATHLSEFARHVIEGGGTEPPFNNKYYKHKDHGVYTCAKCGAVLYTSEDKFDSGSGWPAFDRPVMLPKVKSTESKHQAGPTTFLQTVFQLDPKFVKNKNVHTDPAYRKTKTYSNVRKLTAADNEDPNDDRNEIRCGRCGGHLGHAFFNEKFTDTNRRDCVNSVSMKFYGIAYFAGGCFWGVEDLLEKLDGVKDVESG